MRKNIYKFFILLSVASSTLSLSSCNESKFLEEEALSFYSAGNSMQTATDFQTSLNYLYWYLARNIWNLNANSECKCPMYYGTDFAHTGLGTPDVPVKLDDYKNFMIPTWVVPSYVWQEWYKIIYHSNVIIDKAPLASELTDDQRKSITAEALFFRAYSHNILADLFGGVPIAISETTTPARDYVRATRDEVYAQAKLDLETAIMYLEDIDDVADGKVSKQAAQNLLAQVCNSLGDYDAAIAASTAVIDHPSMALMTNRFGTYADRDGDVHTDLFREGNLNRSTSGNTETLFVLQFDYLSAASTVSRQITFNQAQYTSIATVAEDGNSYSACVGRTEEKHGHGIGWMRPTYFFHNTLWESDFDNDMRNSEYAIKRDIQIDNPDSPHFGMWLVKDGLLRDVDTLRNWYPLMSKFSPTTFPSDQYVYNSDGSQSFTELGETIIQYGTYGYKDEYLMRLAETYLLRAEAYIGKGNSSAAADDINVVRNRANATPITAAEADIDYLLDERLRELYYEELRMVQLCRLGKHYDRTSRYNWWSGRSIEEYHNLWPIPYSEIEANVYATLEQNPGYTN